MKLTFFLGQENEIILILGGRARWPDQLVAQTGPGKVRMTHEAMGPWMRRLSDQSWHHITDDVKHLHFSCHWKNIMTCLSWPLIDAANINLWRAKGEVIQRDIKETEKVYIFTGKEMRDIWILWWLSSSSVLVICWYWNKVTARREIIGFDHSLDSGVGVNRLSSYIIAL